MNVLSRWLVLPVLVLVAGVARADVTVKRVAGAEDLIGGIKALGKTGDYLLSNGQAAVIVEDLRASSGLHRVGGLPLDAGRVNADGKMNFSLLDEVIPAVIEPGQLMKNPRVFTPKAISIEKDENGPYLKVTGQDGGIPFLAQMLGKSGKSLELDMVFEHRMDAAAPVLHSRLTITNRGAEARTVQVGSMFLLGDGLKSFVPDLGYSFFNKDAAEPLIVYEGPSVSYGYAFPGDPQQELLNFSFISLSGGAPHTLSPGQSLTLNSALSMGTGGVASAQAPFLKGTGTVTGRVGIPATAPVAEVIVSRPGAEKPFTMARTDAQGNFSVALPPGQWALRAGAEQHVPGETQTVTVEAGKTANVELPLAPATLVKYEVVDDKGPPIPATFTLENTEELSTDPVLSARGRTPHAYPKVHFSGTGKGSFVALPGHYTLYVSRGLEYEMHQQTVFLHEGETYPVKATLKHSVNTTGYIGADLHVHSQGSFDTDELFDEKVVAAAAVGLEVPVSTEHEHIGDFGPSIQKLGLSAHVKGIIGTEVTTTHLGHFNAYPLKQRPDLPNMGAVDWIGKDGREIFRLMNEELKAQVVQINHPRAPGLAMVQMGYFNAVNYKSSSGKASKKKDWSLDFNALEVQNGKSAFGFERQIDDWVSFLDRGMRVVGVGNSDSHESYKLELGFPRTMVRVSDDDPAKLDEAEFITHLKEQRATVNGGNFVTVGLNGDADALGRVHHNADGKYELHVKVQSPTWVDLTRVKLLENGKTIENIEVPPSQEVVKFDRTFTLKPKKDAHYIVVAYGKEDLRPVYPGGRPLSFTNPVYIDVDGDGEIRPSKKPFGK